MPFNSELLEQRPVAPLKTPHVFKGQSMPAMLTDKGKTGIVGPCVSKHQSTLTKATATDTHHSLRIAKKDS